jgi:Ca2+-binding RTX toxin-like protein
MFGSTQRTTLQLESLDRRDLPSATVALAGSVLTIKADDFGDTAIVSEAGNKIVVTVNGQTTTEPKGAVSLIVFTGGAGDDVFINTTSIASFADGGAGNDVLVGGRGVNILSGGSGNDTLVGGPKNDILMGGSGDDVLVAGPGRNVLLGGSGHDTYFGNVSHDLFDDRGIDSHQESEANDDPGSTSHGDHSGGHS